MLDGNERRLQKWFLFESQYIEDPHPAIHSRQFQTNIDSPRSNIFPYVPCLAFLPEFLPDFLTDFPMFSRNFFIVFFPMYSPCLFSPLCSSLFFPMFFLKLTHLLSRSVHWYSKYNWHVPTSILATSWNYSVHREPVGSACKTHIRETTHTVVPAMSSRYRVKLQVCKPFMFSPMQLGWRTRLSIMWILPADCNCHLFWGDRPVFHDIWTKSEVWPKKNSSGALRSSFWSEASLTFAGAKGPLVRRMFKQWILGACHCLKQHSDVGQYQPSKIWMDWI